MMTDDEIEELRKMYAPHMPPWKQPPPPPAARPGWLTKVLRDLANQRAVSPDLLALDPWSHVGGSVEFKCNGLPIRRRKVRS
jgi:hypothetical protein